MKCRKCKAEMRKVAVEVLGAKNKAISYQCRSCDYFEFDPAFSKRVVEELRESPLKIEN